MADEHDDNEFFGIKPQQSAYELEHFDKRDQEFLTRLSILSQQCILLRSRNSSQRLENATLRHEILSLRQELEPLKALHQKVTSGYAMLALLGALFMALIAAATGIRELFWKK